MQYGRQWPYAHVRPLPHWLVDVHIVFTAPAPELTHETPPLVLFVMSHVWVPAQPHCGSSPHAFEGAVVAQAGPPLLVPLDPLDVPLDPLDAPLDPLDAPDDPLDVPPSPDEPPLEDPLAPEDDALDDDPPLDELLGGSGWLAGGSVGSWSTS